MMFWQYNILSASSLIAFVFGNILFQYRFYDLLFKVQAVQDVIHLSNESHTGIQLSIKIYLRNPLDHLVNL